MAAQIEPGTWMSGGPSGPASLASAWPIGTDVEARPERFADERRRVHDEPDDRQA